MTQQREEILYFAKLAEQAERYSDMVKYIKNVANSGEELNSEERNLLSIAYKNYIGSRRAAWRALAAIEMKEETKGSKNLDVVRKYKAKVEKEVSDICAEILELLDKHLIPHSKSSDCQVFYHKMKGDYCRYNAECASGEQKKTISNKALESYQSALEIAEKNLASTNPCRLGLALNFSVFYYEIMGNPEKACNLAKTTFDAAISDLEGLDDDAYKDSATILQLIKDNLAIWNTDLEDNKKADEPNN
jgi:14-3-3 protein epsilon